MDLIKALNEKQLQAEKPQVNVGDTVKVHVKVKEGSRERIQVFEGTVIAKKHGGIEETITVRRLSYGVGVEKVFPVHSPSIEKIETVRSGFVRRTICVTGSARPPRSERSCKQRAENRRPLSAVFMSKTKSQQTSFSPADSFCNICNIRYTAECSRRTHHGW